MKNLIQIDVDTPLSTSALIIILLTHFKPHISVWCIFLIPLAIMWTACIIRFISEYKKPRSVDIFVSNKSLDSVSEEVKSDIRNKLTPVVTLLSMIDKKHIINTDKEIEKQNVIAKECINYLSQKEVYS